ncbi:unnamed protein product [Hyaloperonospora brassicae]|uniref:Uncharacterized protein n=1 Tax=Hyaloperonospora brassicae TaxID=162125 RepID=A0AAV0UTK1_HYABA|nr:unnamed protein product [Hyaloperonospora brassicae]
MQTTDDEFSALKCRYASKRCWNLRAIKRNGERHNLCEMHRQKANSNQRRLDKKRKAGQAPLGLPAHLSPHATGADLERRMRMRASIALKLERELGALPLTTQYIRPPPRATAALAELPVPHRHGAFRSSIDAWRESARWLDAAYPRSPRAMLRAAAMAKATPADVAPDSRKWTGHRRTVLGGSPSSKTVAAVIAPREAGPSMLLPSIATAVARSSEGLKRPSSMLQRAWQPEGIRRTPALVARANM